MPLLHANCNLFEYIIWLFWGKLSLSKPFHSTKSFCGSSVWEMRSFRSVSLSKVMMKVSEVSPHVWIGFMIWGLSLLSGIREKSEKPLCKCLSYVYSPFLSRSFWSLRLTVCMTLRLWLMQIILPVLTFPLAETTMFVLIHASSTVQSLLLWPHLHNNPCPCGRLRQGSNQCSGRQARVSWRPASGQPQLGRRWEWQQLRINQMTGDSTRQSSSEVFY